MNQFQKNVKDYLLPEIRALEDKNDVKSLKKAMEFDKVQDQGFDRSRDKLYEILKDLYYKQDPVFKFDNLDLKVDN